jgi:3-hydroxyacyl-[acyl-carrier-protein] dehydratase
MLDIKEIMKIIPHRSPFLLVDRVEEMELGKRVVAKKCVSYNEPFFTGHFPQEPVMPGVLIIEALAQAGAVCALSAEENKGKIAFLGGVNKAKFRGKVVPGDVLRLEVEMIKIKGPVGVAKGTATVDGKVVASGEITFMIG